MGNTNIVFALLQGTPDTEVNSARMNGFLKGLGASQDDAVADLITNGDRTKGQTAMENALAKNTDINLVWAVNEPAALGAATAIEDRGLTDQIKIVTMDGSCSGIEALQNGRLSTDVVQFPAKMAELAIELGVKATKGEEIRESIDSGEALVTDNPQDGVPSETIEYGLSNCWGK